LKRDILDPLPQVNGYLNGGGLNYIRYDTSKNGN
jgi:hypothetical protein